MLHPFLSIAKDVIDVLTCVGSEREIDKNGKVTKLNVIASEASGHKIQCTIFGHYVDELNTFMASGEQKNVVVIVQLAKVKLFQDHFHIQNCMNCTKLVFNPTCLDGQAMRNSIVVDPNVPQPHTLTQLHAEPKIETKDEFLYNTQKSTIQGLKDCQGESMFVVLGKITQILNPENWWYTECICSKSVYANSKMYFCEKCNKHIIKVFPRYCLKVLVMDNTDSATLVIFDKDVTVLFNKTCAEMLQSRSKDSGHCCLPADLKALINATILFKVETKPTFSPMFEQSFKVRKICTDGNIISEFKQKCDSEEAAFLKNANESTSLSALVDKGIQKAGNSQFNVFSQLDVDDLSFNDPKVNNKVTASETIGVSEDLMPKFTLARVEAHIGMVPPFDIITHQEKGSPTEDLTFVAEKRGSPTEEEDGNVPLKLLKRKIKKENI